jgi:hypothetical protein
MNAMTPKRRDHLWVLFVIAAFALFDVWGAWAQVGDKSGFAVGHTGTGWTLTVIVEAAAGYFLFAWFDAPGLRSRRCAMWSAIATLTLSLVGQGASILAATAKPPLWLSVFVKDLPVVVLALIAVLIHLRRLDREAAAATGERTAVQAEMDALRADLAEAVSGLTAVSGERDEAVAKAETLARKLEATTTQKRRAATGRKSPRATGRKPDPVTGSATAPEPGTITAPADTPDEDAPADLDSEAKVLWYLDKGLSASKAGIRAGLTDSRGRQIARLRKPAPADAVDSQEPAR